MADDRLASHACASTKEVQRQQRRGIQTGTASNDRREIRFICQFANEWPYDHYSRLSVKSEFDYVC